MHQALQFVETQTTNSFDGKSQCPKISGIKPAYGMLMFLISVANVKIKAICMH